MADLGLEPKVTHAYEVPRNKPRQTVSYECARCGVSFESTPSTVPRTVATDKSAYSELPSHAVRNASSRHRGRGEVSLDCPPSGRLPYRRPLISAVGRVSLAQPPAQHGIYREMPSHLLCEAPAGKSDRFELVRMAFA